MNERIRELALQACEEVRFNIDPHTFKHIDDPDGEYIRVEFDKEKFAELIVRECVDIASKYDEPKMSGPGLMIGHMIEQHFGVRE